MPDQQFSKYSEAPPVVLGKVTGEMPRELGSSHPQTQHSLHLGVALQGEEAVG